MKLLIVEDDRDLLKSMLLYLNESGYNCEYAKSIQGVNDRITDHQYDCVVLDLSLPDGNSLSTISNIKNRQAECGIIIVSANSNLDDKILGLDLGADDYLTKPFNLSE